MAMDTDANNTAHKPKGHAPGSAEPVPPDARALARDWIDLWQSELSALNADPAVREGWQAVASLWAGAMATMLRPTPPQPAGHDGPTRCPRAADAAGAGAADAAGAASAAVAPDARDAEIARLSRHVAALEGRVAELERAAAAGAAAKRRKRKP